MTAEQRARALIEGEPWPGFAPDARPRAGDLMVIVAIPVAVAVLCVVACAEGVGALWHRIRYGTWPSW